MLKLFLSTLLLTGSLLTIQAQTVEDYFLPEAPINKVDYSTPESSMTTSKFYTVKDSIIIVQDSNFVQGEYLSTEVKTFLVVNNEIHLIRSEFFYGKYAPKIYDFDTAQVTLKIPAKKDTITWTSVDPIKGTINYSASWRVTEKNNEKFTLLRVAKSVDYTKVKEVEFYAEKIGLLKTEVVTSDGSGLTKLRLERMSYVPE